MNPACMGGWCHRRSNCSRHHNTTGQPLIERLCADGTTEHWAPMPKEQNDGIPDHMRELQQRQVQQDADGQGVEEGQRALRQVAPDGPGDQVEDERGAVLDRLGLLGCDLVEHPGDVVPLVLCGGAE